MNAGANVCSVLHFARQCMVVGSRHKYGTGGISLTVDGAQSGAR